MESFPPSEIQYEEAHIHQSQQVAAYGVPIAFFALAICFVCIRLVSRQMHHTKLALDDYLAIAGLLALIPFMAATLGEVKNGVGRHILSLTQEELVMQAKWVVVNLYSYTTCITLIKLSILALLSRIFDVYHRVFQIAIWILTVWMILWAIALYFAYGFQCQPFSRNWSLADPCKPSLRLEYSASILNAVHDVLLFFLPQPIIWKLHLPLKKKLTVSVTFFIGFVATLMGILKIAYVQGAPGSSHKIDSTYTIVPALIFNALEPLLALICSCLPSTPLFFRRVRIEGFLRITSLLRSVRSKRSQRSGSDPHNGSEPSWDQLPGSRDDHSTRNIYIKQDISVDASRDGGEDIALQNWIPDQKKVGSNMV